MTELSKFAKSSRELTQVKYNVKHTNKPNNQGVASVMGRDKDWVRYMREKLREAGNETRR